MKRRFNGEGNIRKRSEHSWKASVAVADKRYYLYGSSRADVKEQLEQLQAKLDDGDVIDIDKTVGDWMDEWCECYTAKVKESSRSRYRQDIQNHINPTLGHIKLQELKMPTVQRFLNACKNEKGLSQKSLKNIYLVLNKAMALAQTQGLVRANPCAQAEVPSYEEPPKEMRPLTNKEVQIFLSHILGHPFETLYYTALFTGMRESELIGLTWDCINFDTGNIHLYRQLKAVKGKSSTWTFTTLKNKQTRDFILPPSVIRMLKKQKAKQAEWKLKFGEAYCNNNGLVFTDELGSHLATRTVYERFKRIMRMMNLPQVRFHDLRHTYATLALENGIDYKTLSHNLGHATVAFTMDKYGHVSETMQITSAEKMESFIQTL